MLKWIFIFVAVLSLLFIRRRDRIILTCFAGRKFNLEILLKYVDKLIKSGEVSEFHIWNFTRKNDDEIYVKSLKNKYKVITPVNKDKWNEYYDYYRSYGDNDVIIKMDDDILFIDTVMFKDFIEIVKTDNSLAVFPSIINNGVCAYYQQKYDILPKSLHEFKYETYYGEVVNGGALGTKIHEYFIKNKENIISKSRSIKPNIIKHNIGDRISINFFGITGKNFKKLKFTDKCDDEHELSVENTKRLNMHLTIFMNFIVCHGSFGPQKNTGLDEQYICSLYKDE
jgi:hypothetical protein